MRELTGKNDGVMVEKYLRSVGLPKGNPYCAAGQYWSFTQVTAIPCILKTGLVVALWNWAKRTGTETPYVVEVGDILNWNYGGTKSHEERVYKRHAHGWVTTIGFNVGGGSGGNTRDGGGVELKKRNVWNPLGQAMMRGAIGRLA